MNVIFAGKIIRIRRSVIIAIQKANSNLELPFNKLEKFVNDSLLANKNNFLDKQITIKQILNKFPEKRTKRLDRVFASAIKEYKSGKLKAFTNAKDYFTHLDSL